MDIQRMISAIAHSPEARHYNRVLVWPCGVDPLDRVVECFQAATDDVVSKDHLSCPTQVNFGMVEIQVPLVVLTENRAGLLPLHRLVGTLDQNMDSLSLHSLRYQ